MVVPPRIRCIGCELVQTRSKLTAFLPGPSLTLGLDTSVRYNRDVNADPPQ